MVSTVLSLARVTLNKREPAKGHFISVKFCGPFENGAIECLIWCKWKADAEEKYRDYTGPLADKLDMLKAKRLSIYRHTPDSPAHKIITRLNLN